MPSGDYDNVFFHLTSLGSLTGTLNLTVTGSQDGPSNPNRSFNYFDLISYLGNVNAPNYQLLFSGPPTTVNGFETVTGIVSLNDVGPYFVYQFRAPEGPGGAPRIFWRGFNGDPGAGPLRPSRAGAERPRYHPQPPQESLKREIHKSISRRSVASARLYSGPFPGC